MLYLEPLAGYGRETTFPSFMSPKLAQVFKSMDPLTKCVDPSSKDTPTPPVWRLCAANRADDHEGEPPQSDKDEFGASQVVKVQSLMK